MERKEVPPSYLHEVSQNLEQAVKDKRLTQEQAEEFVQAYVKGFLGRLFIEDSPAQQE